MLNPKDQNQQGNPEKEQNVFSGNEEDQLQADFNEKMRQTAPDKDDKDDDMDKDVYRSRNLEIEKERD